MPERAEPRGGCGQLKDRDYLTVFFVLVSVGVTSSWYHLAISQILSSASFRILRSTNLEYSLPNSALQQCPISA